ncbi:MAG: type II toxin-antitoxin system PemK/MazF family toxin [Lactobacillaceae bacterium]|jgi:mRNA interferase MazF|nr:type II toxin-antitoxin system PemK/MazF family toxin [Lactobacillaceae bacterium]
MMKAGDIYMMDYEPHVGREIGGHNPGNGNIRRPFLIISNFKYQKSGSVLAFPITTSIPPKKVRHLYFPIKLIKDSYVKTTQLVSYDPVARNAKKMDYSIPDDKLQGFRLIARSYLE